jgi:hypothetical protein
MPVINKTFSLLFCDQQKFLAVRNKIIKVEAPDHETAMGLFLIEYNEKLINKKIMSFCYEDEAKKYGYLYETVSKPE